MASHKPSLPTRDKKTGQFIKAGEPLKLKSIEQAKIEDSKRDAERELRHLRRNYSKLITESRAIDRLVDKAQETIAAFPPIKFKPHPLPANSKAKNESAGLLISDAHVGKVVHGTQTLGFGDYSFQRFTERLFFLEERVRFLLRHRIHAHIDELVVFFLGDMLDGSLQHGNEITDAMTRFDQWYAAAYCFSQFLMNIAKDIETVKVKTAVGNHGRNPDQRKMPTSNRYSNIDHFLYAMIKEMVRDQKNIAFDLDYQPYCHTVIRGATFIGMHGDHLRGGDKQWGVPAHAMARMVNGITQMYEAKHMTAPHYWVAGDKHRHIMLPTVKGQFIFNGAFVGDDNYSLSLSTSSEPMQLLFGVHEKYLKCWEMDIKLRHAPRLESLPYAIPEGLQSVLR